MFGGKGVQKIRCDFEYFFGISSLLHVISKFVSEDNKIYEDEVQGNIKLGCIQLIA